MRSFRRYVTRFAERLDICECLCASLKHEYMVIYHRGKIDILIATADTTLHDYFVGSKYGHIFVVFDCVGSLIHLAVEASSMDLVPAGVRSLGYHIEYFIH